MNRTTITVLLIVLVIAGAWYLNSLKGAKAITYSDGTYEGDSETDNMDQYGTIKLVVKDGKITSADFTEFNSDGTPKDETYPYPAALDAMRVLESRLVKVQDPSRVDNVTGATGTWEKFKEAANQALAEAK